MTKDELQALFNKASMKASDLNAKAIAVIQSDSFDKETYDGIKKNLKDAKAKRDAIQEQIDAYDEEHPEKPEPTDNNQGTALPSGHVGTTRDQQRKSMRNFLKTGVVTTDLTGAGLSDGSILIPETILPAEHETHQFPRLGNMVRTVQVSTTTGKLPVFQESGDTLSLHKEFDETTPSSTPRIVPIPWDLQTYTGRYVFSQDLISDSSYDWEAEFGSRLVELQNNTDDMLIANKLTDGITATATTDLISDIKHALNKFFKPFDSAQASIILSQSAFDELDNMKDSTGRPMVQPDVTQATDGFIKGKPLVVLDDLLFPKAKVGDANIIISPLQKSIIKFRNNQITGEFQDTHDIWYKSLGMYLREDVEQARKDLICLISSSAPSGK
ncbi:phage major capsid protein [Furfurilactobacillus siliginis]|uniref:Phage capsid protein n=1 Tax=Furfurilactobacillus siliginis TaxID=348151 RepID=A0A0R2L676_9LACO|nr:phage major capsid protein [Furfurilactobacillus siliginis]KRN96848.1 phage capsid protein [Furfurilactobacillus siliginis]GEK28515.1 phage capsid protein [Furfurilactobacillus siliginis]